MSSGNGDREWEIPEQIRPRSPCGPANVTSGLAACLNNVYKYRRAADRAQMRYLSFLIAAAIMTISPASGAQSGGNATEATTAPQTPTVALSPASSLRLSGTVDSNSPAIWEVERGREILHVITSAGRPSVATGTSLRTLGAARESDLVPWPAGANWMEAVVSDSQGTWYGYYHNERNAADLCPGTALGSAQIGAARSIDRGLTWEDLGIILEAPRGSQSCDTRNKFFVDGVGDFSVQLDPDSTDLYIFFSAYPRQIRLQGVSVARLRWADRDQPAGNVAVWNNGIWRHVYALRPSAVVLDKADVIRWVYPAATPFYQASQSWHNSDGVVDAFWGPSVHWNTYLKQYVMLLNRAKDSDYDEEGIYVAFSPTLDDPRKWSTPKKVLSGGSWYPQVIGTEPGVGTDKIAGQTARFFMKGESTHLITFSK
jgi:hypothetical protein